MREKNYAYASEQATNCAVCGEHKHTPLRRDDMGGYVCLTCIDKELNTRHSPDDRLRKAAEYLDHKAGCVFHGTGFCNCGLKELRAALSAESASDGRIDGLQYGVYLCDAKGHIGKNESYRAACSEIKLSLEAAIERVQMGEQMESVAYTQSAETEAGK